MNEFANSKENGVRKRDEAVFLDGIEVRKGVTDANGKEFVDDKAKPEAKYLRVLHTRRTKRADGMGCGGFINNKPF